MKTGLVLEGGAMRGMFTAGVLDSWMDEQISFDGIVGVSAGALFGINAPAGQKGRAIRYNLKYIRDKRYMGLRSLLTTGNLINADFAFYEVSSKLDIFDEAAFQRSGVDFYAAVTDLHTGAPEYIRITEPFRQMEALRATSAMPYVSRPVELDGRFYLDGGSATVFQSISARVWATTRPFSCSHVPWSIGKSGPQHGFSDSTASITIAIRPLRRV